MKNKMKNFFNLNIIIIIFIISLNTYLYSDEFYFEGQEIQIFDEGNRLVSKEGVKITTDNNLIIFANEFEYNKNKSELLLEGDIIVNDNDREIILKSEKLKYSKKTEKIITYGITNITIGNKYFIDSSDVNFFKKDGFLSSNQKTTITDKFENNFISQNFKFILENELIKAENVVLKDEYGNRTELSNFFGNIQGNEYFGKDLKIIFKKDTFGNSKNDPRLYGNTVTSNKNISKISKGVFTTCKMREKCPPWKLNAEEVVHDKTKKIINYKNAWLNLYDKPVIYFPKFFHPDPTVKRQSGFLVPNISESGNTGTSLSTPYFKVLDINKDFTFKPRFFTNNNLLMQGEYRQVEKNINHIMDLGIFTSEMNNNTEPSKSHFFSNTIIDLEDKIFETSNFEINFEQVSNDTYIKKFKPRSQLIDSENLMHNFVKFNGYDENSSINMTIESYEDLTKNSSDKYEYIYPNVEYTKDILNTKLPGSLNFKSNFYQKLFETNKYKQSLITDIIYKNDTKFNLNGLTRDFQILFKNPNLREKTGSNNETNNESKILTKLMYSFSYPLKKEGQIYDRFLKPNLSVRFSPNNTKNISNEDRRLGINNINTFNRLSMNDGVEGGQSITAGIDYQLKNKLGDDKISLNLSQVFRDKANPDLPTNSSLNNKYSDIIGKVKFDLFDNLNFEYDFMLDNNLDKTNYNYLEANINVNNFLTSFQFLEEDGEIGTKSYLENQTKYSFDENNSLSFSTRRNRELDMTEFYNLIYQYENDCLKAAIEYNKSFYNDSDVKPEEELLFTITIVPFTKISSTNVGN
tara:strand:- start:3572 stop:5983 length:2412 start_codon:yes stop_codon:yes gene_type:complete